jgi:hypothetical protein
MCVGLLNIGILTRRSEGKNAGGRYRPPVPPSLLAALGLGLRALVRAPWLIAVGALVAAVRRAATWPALLLLGIAVGRAALATLAERPLDPTAPLDGALAALGSPRLLGVAGGLWLAGIALGWALRVAWLAGALPTLAGAMAGAPAPRFATGVAYRFPRVAAVAALGAVAELAGALFAVTLALAALRVGVAAPGPLAAAGVAFALVVALAVPLALGVFADAAVARAAIRGDPAGAALAAAARRLLARPGAFLLAALGFAVAAVAGPGAVEAAGTVATGFAAGAHPILLVGPHAMAAAVALVVAAAIDLVALGTVAALACAGPARAAGATLSGRASA